MDIVIKNINLLTVERGRLMLCIPTEDGAHTYQQIDNPYLIARLKSAATKDSNGKASIRITISGSDGSSAVSSSGQEDNQE